MTNTIEQTQTKYDELNSQRETLRQARETLIAERQQLEQARRASSGAGASDDAMAASYLAGRQIEAKARKIADADRDAADIARQLTRLALTVAGIDNLIADKAAQLAPGGYYEVKIRQAQQTLDVLKSAKVQAEQDLAAARADRQALAPDDYKPRPGTYQL
jgi:chromosome segregation ATPase